MERKETRELDARIRRRWAEWEERISDRTPLTGVCARWEERAAALARRPGDDLIRRAPTVMREREAPSDVAAGMNEVTPQAVLRDLHRPVTQFGISGYDRLETGWDRGGRQGTLEAKQPLRERYYVPVETVLRTP